MPHRYSPAEIATVYRVIAERRDMRHFLPDPSDPAILARLLEAANRGPSVGLMQPWRFVPITAGPAGHRPEHRRGPSIDSNWPDPRPRPPPTRFDSLSRQPPLAALAREAENTADPGASGRSTGRPVPETNRSRP